MSPITTMLILRGWGGNDMVMIKGFLSFVIVVVIVVIKVTKSS